LPTLDGRELSWPVQVRLGSIVPANYAVKVR
jgi:hypothetical protein